MNLTGKIKDEFGNPLAGVTVELFEQGSGVATDTTLTNADGIWTFAAVDETKVWQVISTAAGSQKREVYTGNDVAVSEITVKDHLQVNGTLSLPSQSVTNAMLNADVPRGTANNLLTNGGFEIWQRGAGPFAVNGAYTADRWKLIVGPPSTVSVTRISSTIGLPAYSMQVVYAHGPGSAQIVQYIEEHARYSQSTVSARVRVKSTVAGTVFLRVQDDTGSTDSAFNVGVGLETLSVTRTVLNANLRVIVCITTDSCTVEINDATLVWGAVPADYVPLHPTEEMARCQRYYRVLMGHNGAAVLSFTCYADNARNYFWHLPHPTKMAVAAPSATKVGTWALANVGSSSLRCTDDMLLAIITATGAGHVEMQPNSADDLITVEANP